MAGAATARLDAAGQTLALASSGGPPALVYWGPTLPVGADLAEIATLTARAVPHGMLDEGETYDLFPETGRGFAGRPALQISRADGRFLTQLRLADLACDGAIATAVLEDRAAGARVTQRFEAFASGVIVVSARLDNIGADALCVHRFAPAALPSPWRDGLRFGGRWTGEFALERARLGHGALVSENRTGRTSHHAPPFLIVGEDGFGEASGTVLGVHLGWSGDSETVWERLRDGRAQIQLAPLFGPGEILLAPGASFETPPLYAALSDAGLTGLSDRFHPFVRDALMGGRLKGRPRPVTFNTWEAVYYQQDTAAMIALAEQAAALGVERFVLDDGWFAGRRDDTAGLGDWRADPHKHPHGLAPLAERVRALGMEFGLWVEPESVNRDSDLFRAHPEWILQEAGRDQPVGRGQYVLDLTRPEATQAIFAQLNAIIREAKPAFLKWDFNRDLTHAASDGRPAGVAQTRAVYALIDRVRAAHPQLEIEACASGGARADYAMLTRSERIWTSDCNDPFDRQRQQRAFSLFFPPEVMGAHVGPRVSHTTDRSAALETRAMTALFGHFGVEADLAALCEEERRGLAEAIALHKSLRPRLHGGRLVRLEHPDPGVIAFAVVHEAGQIVSVAQVDTPAFAAPAPLRLRALAPQARYRIALLNPPARPEAAMKNPPDWAKGAPRVGLGAALMREGLPLPVLRPGHVRLFELEPIS